MTTSPSFVERRTAVRKACSFDVHVASSTGQQMKGVGLEVSAGGLVFIAPRGGGADVLNVVALIRSHKVQLAVKVLRSDPIPYQMETWQKLACAIQQPPPEWTRAIEAVMGGGATAPPAPPPQVKGGEVTFGTLPASAQQSIISQLIDLKRLAPPRAGHAPLLRVTLGPEYRDPFGKTIRRYRVHSRIAQHHKTQSFETIFLVSERGEVTRER